jgi:DNA-binding phage protein
MALTRNYRHTVIERIQRDPQFARALLEEAATVFLRGEPAVARLTLRDLVHATVGFEALAVETRIPSKSLHRMLSAKGNPCMDNLSMIFAILQNKLGTSVRGTQLYPVEEALHEAPT